MAFTIRNLSVLAYANGFTLWHYKAHEDSLAAVAGRNFFGGAADLIAFGDLLMVSAIDGARLLSVAAVGEQVMVTTLT